MKKKICSSCGIECFLWKSTPKLCKSCALKNSTPIGEFTMTSNKTLQSTKTFKPINKQSDKEKKRQAQYKLVRAYYISGHPNCEAQLNGCTLESTDIHHQKGKIGKLLIDMNFFVALCRSCHSYLEVHPKEAKELGFSLNRLDK